MSVSPLILKAPLSGTVYPLERVPDPVFSQKLVGDGISIDPTDNLLRAPCAGEVTQIHAAGHAATLVTPEGIEVLIHIGIDTVSLKGKGFTPKAAKGDRVETGTPLIEFDIDYIATHAKSLLTQVLITNTDRVAKFEYGSGEVKVQSDTILALTLGGADTATQNTDGATSTSPAILVPNPTGWHARPAAVLANIAKSFKSDIRLRKGDREGNARSITSIMGLEVGHGDKVVVVAKGPDAVEAVRKLGDLIAEGLGDEGTKPAPAPATMSVSENSAPAPRPRSGDPNELPGVSASPGLAVGTVFQVRRVEIEVAETGGTPDQEREKLRKAVDEAKGQLDALRAQLHARSDAGKAAIFAAHAELIEDPDLVELATSAIAKGKSAAFAWKRAVEVHAQRLASLRNELLAQRANDLRDVGERVLQILTGTTRKAPQYPPQAILIAEDLAPSDVAALESGGVTGFCTLRGGATSHVAILARSLGLPAIAGIDPRALEIQTGTPAILDGGKATLRINPPGGEIDRIRTRQTRQEALRKENLAHAHEPAVTKDGKRIEVVANVGGAKDAQQVHGLGGEGVGLLRSEFLFMERADAPDEEEQFRSYKEVADALGRERPLIIRTLDVGGDKPLAYLPIPKEDNPFLGERGIRVGLDRPEILRTQLRAILRTAEFAKVHVMFPMIATLAELRDARAILSEEAAKLGAKPIPCGIMVEVPSVAVMAEVFAREADFFSIGTNDLTQYTLAMDRGHPKLAPKVDALNPGVLRLIALTVEGAHKHGKWVGVCGGIAGDPYAVPLLVGMGVDELSVSLPAIPAVKAQIRSLAVPECQALAKKALACGDGSEVRALFPEMEE